MALDFFAGCVGGCAGVMVGHPFDTIKVKLQTQNYKNPMYRGTLDCFSKILKTESVAGLYRGVSSPMAGVAVVNALVFGVYGNVQRSMSEPNSLRTHFLAGAAAGLTQSIIASPVELVKSRVQINNLYQGPWDCFLKTYKQEGVRGIFKGLGVTGVREFLGYGLYFATYEALTKTSPGEAPIGTAKMLLAGGISGTISWMFTYPLDVVKTRLQVDIGTYSSFSDCVKKSVESEGIVCLTRGLTPTLIRAFPTNAVTFTVVTWVFRLSELSLENTNNMKAGIIAAFENFSFTKNIATTTLVEGGVTNKGLTSKPLESDDRFFNLSTKNISYHAQNECFSNDINYCSSSEQDEFSQQFDTDSFKVTKTDQSNQELDEYKKILR